MSSILSCMDNLLNRFQVQQFPLTHPPVSKQFLLFFICRLETFLTATAANLSVQSNKTNPPVLHHVTLLDQSKPRNRSRYNPRDHKEFQLTNIFPFTKLHPRDYTRFFHNFCDLNFSTIMTVRFIWFFYFTIHYLTHTLTPPSLYPVLHPWHLHLPLAIHLI